jgi:alpha-glucosidase
MLSAFFPFYRNHNIIGAISQEPYRWDSVANASRTAISARYSLLPYWYTLFANSSLRGTPPMRALFFEFPDEQDILGVDQQFLVGRDILVTPVLTPGANTVEGFFPGRGQITWRDWFTHEAVETSENGKATLQAPLGTINVHVRDGSVLLLYANPAYTTTETRAGNYSLLISLDSNGAAQGQAYIDDGISLPPGDNRIIDFSVANGTVTLSSTGAFEVQGVITSIVVLGATNSTESGQRFGSGWEHEEGKQKLVNNVLSLDLNEGTSTVSWVN